MPQSRSSCSALKYIEEIKNVQNSNNFNYQDWQIVTRRIWQTTEWNWEKQISDFPCLVSWNPVGSPTGKWGDATALCFLWSAFLSFGLAAGSLSGSSKHFSTFWFLSSPGPLSMSTVWYQLWVKKLQSLRIETCKIIMVFPSRWKIKAKILKPFWKQHLFSEKLAVPYFKTHYKATSIKTMWYYSKL